MKMRQWNGAFATIKIDENSSMKQRYIDILLYAKRHYPNDFVPKNIMYKIANRRATAPSMKSKEVASIVLTNVKKALLEEHDEVLLSGGGGARLATSHTERLTLGVPPARKRVQSAVDNLVRIADHTDIDKVPSSPTNDVLKRDFLMLTERAINKLRDPKLQAALALPEHEE